MDRFDIQRQWDNAEEEVEKEARRKLEDDEDRVRARNKRLIKLSVGHYYDPLEKTVLSKAGSQYIVLKHDQSIQRKADEKIRAQAKDAGFKLVKNGIYWNTKTRHLYVKHGARYVLYSLGRRKSPRPS